MSYCTVTNLKLFQVYVGDHVPPPPSLVELLVAR